MTSEPDYDLKHDRSHACAVPWGDGGAGAHWRCPECGRWWERTWELAGDQPPVDYDRLARRAGIPRDEVELKRQRVIYREGAGLDYVLWTPEAVPGARGWPLIVYLHGGGEGGGHPSGAARGGLPRQVEQGLTLPWMVVSPHCPDPPQPNRPSWSEYADEVAAVVGEVRLTYPVDDTAVLLSGRAWAGTGPGVALSRRVRRGRAGQRRRRPAARAVPGAAAVLRGPRGARRGRPRRAVA